MIAKLITFSARNRFFILLLTFFAIVGGIVALKNTPLDAIPDLSDVQVIVYTEWSERSPTLIEDQVTYPIVTSLLSVPKVKVVRGYSFFGYSFVYVIFQDGTDLYWARTRVLEYMQAVARRDCHCHWRHGRCGDHHGGKRPQGLGALGGRRAPR